MSSVIVSQSKIVYFWFPSVDPTCDNKLLLHFPYELNFDDVTCHKAKGYSYGEGAVQIMYDAERDQNVAQFDGESRIEVRFSPCMHAIGSYRQNAIAIESEAGDSLT